MHLTVYTKPGCHLCEDVLQMLDRVAARYGIELAEVNILDTMALYEQYKEIIPVVEATDVSVGRLVAPIDESGLRGYLDKAFAARRNVEASGGRGPVGGKMAGWLSKRTNKKENG